MELYIGPYEEQGIDGVIRSERKQVLQVYELAVLADQPAPPEGAHIQATGRFLKVMACM